MPSSKMWVGCCFLLAVSGIGVLAGISLWGAGGLRAAEPDQDPARGVECSDIRIVFPEDGNGNGLIDDESCEFCFSDGPGIPGIPPPGVQGWLEVECKGTAGYNGDDSKLRWKIENAGDVQATWSPHVPGDETTGCGRDSVFTYRQLPTHNLGFGRKTITLTYIDCPECPATFTIEIFYKPMLEESPGVPLPAPDGITAEDVVE